MRTLADDYHPRLDHNLPPEPAESQDLTLGMTALLGIFFAVVLVCAVFFGFGYSTGRTLHGAKASASAPLAAQATSASRAGLSAAAAEPVSQFSDSITAPSLAATTPATKPLPGSAFPDTAAADRREVSRRAAVTESDAPARVRGVAANQPSYASAPPAAPAAAATPAEDTQAGESAGGGVMVQIAAVVRQADAETLAQALRKNGYPAVVRTESQDKFLHVQIGPFATRDQARAMRARLAAAGYNAFLKQ